MCSSLICTTLSSIYMPTTRTSSTSLWLRGRTVCGFYHLVGNIIIQKNSALVTIRAPRFNIQVSFPSNKYRPEATSIPFVVDVPDVNVFLSLPRWNTQCLYNSGKEHRIIHAATFRITSSYYFWADVQADNIDQLKLTVEVCLAFPDCVPGSLSLRLVKSPTRPSDGLSGT